MSKNMMKYLAPHWKTPMQKRLAAIDFGRMSAIDRLLVRYYMGGNIPGLRDPFAAMMQAQQNALVQQAGPGWHAHPLRAAARGVNPFLGV